VKEIKAYGSLIFSKFPFNSILAAALLAPLIGVIMLCTDGHKAYDIVAHIRCLVHLAKNNAKYDQTLKALIDQGADENTIVKYLSKCYQELKEMTIKILKDGMFKPA
jgi:hypothetical protein